MNNKYQEILLRLKNRGNLTQKEGKALEKIINSNNQSSKETYETSLFQQIATYLGDLFDKKYKFQKHFSSGGFAHTDLVSSKSDNKLYIMKYLHQDKTINQEYRERFIREIINTVLVEHENIPKLMYFGKSTSDNPREEYYYIMEYIEGKSYHQYIFEDSSLNYSNFQKKLILSYVDILEAVKFLHQNKIYHRDCTLSNMIYNPANDKSYLIDLGLSKEFNNSITVTDPEAVHGTPAYIAPESFTLNNHTTPTDVYTLGASLYSIITRSYPHDLSPDDETSIISKISIWLHDTKSCLTLNRFKNSEYSIFNNLVQNSTAFNYEERYQTVDSLLEDYKSLLKQIN